MARISSAFDIAQVSDPATPAANRQMLYFKSDGALYTRRSDASIASFLTTDTAQTITGSRTYTGALASGDGTAAAGISINGAAGTARNLDFLSAGLLRWSIRLTAAAETGGGAGSGLSLRSYDDTGVAYTVIPLTFARSSGTATFGANVNGPGFSFGPASLTLDGPGNTAIELGRTDGTTCTPHIDFHTAAASVDYDARIFVSGSVPGVVASADLSMQGGNVLLSPQRGMSFIDGATDIVTTGVWPDILRFRAQLAALPAGAPTTTIARFDNRGHLGLNSSPGTGNQMMVAADDPATVVARFQGFASQTANLSEWRNSATAILASISAAGLGTFTGLTVNGATTGIGGTFEARGPGVANTNAARILLQSTTGSIYIQPGDDQGGTPVDGALYFRNKLGTAFGQFDPGSATQTWTLNPSLATNKALVVKGLASQSGSLQEWQNSSNVSLAIISAAGLLGAVTLAATGLTGAVSPTRYVGGTASAAPSTGTFVVGDFVIALTGHIFICTVGGTPGTWVEAFPTNMVTTDTTQSISGFKTFTNKVQIDYASGSLELGASAGGANTPFIDFHSGVTGIDYDTRIMASGGNGTPGNGTLTITAATVNVTGTLSEASVRVYSPNNLPTADVIKESVTSQTGTYSVAATISTVLANGTFTVTIPNATTSLGRVINVKDTGTGTITVATSGGNIDGAATAVITKQYNSISVVSDGTNWFII